MNNLKQSSINIYIIIIINVWSVTAQCRVLWLKQTLTTILLYNVWTQLT